MAEYCKSDEKVDWDTLLQNPWANLEKLSSQIAEYPEYASLRDWYEARVKNLPEFRVEDAPLTDGESWVATIGAGGLVEKVARKDGGFYSIEGRRLSKLNPDGSEMFAWTQPVLVSREVVTAVELYGEELNLPVNGFLGVIRDTEDKVLTVVDQEATAETPNHAIVRLAVQASAGKIALMRSGKPEADKQLFELLKIYPGGDVEKLLETAEFILPIAPEDTNRDLKHNLVLVMPAVESGSDLHEKLEAGGVRKWLSRDQLAMVNVSRLTNSHTVAAIKVADDIKLLKAFR